ncbi:MAG: hypothetical protein RL518_2813 [Pseudomonadota bacterium]|jgi:hypothetical protein
MSVVEKEIPQRDVAEHTNGDGASPLKVAKNGVVSHQAKLSRALAVREARPMSGLEVRRVMNERSEALQAFIAPLEEEIRRAGKYRGRARRGSPVGLSKVAELVLKIVRQITHRETGLFALDPNVPLLLSTLYAGSVEASIVSGLVRRAQAALTALSMDEREGAVRGKSTSASAHSLDYDIGRELDEMTMLLKWYVRRKMSLAGLEIDQISKGMPAEGYLETTFDEEDALFGFEVLHDHQVFGTKGCFVMCGVRLVGHDGQPLWLRVSVNWNGRPVSARADWSSWTDPGGSEACEVVPEHAQFCSLVPIRPQAQRLVIDEIRAFIPYAALDLPSGRCDVELVVSVVDNDGREVLSASRQDSICVPRRELVGAHVPAPHSVGMWPHDVVSGDKLSDLRVSSGYKVVAGWERRTVSVQFDLSLFMHAGESVLLECRFIDEKGEIVELSSLGIPYVASELNVPVESVSSYRYRRVLHPRGAWSHYRGLQIDIPVEFLLLSSGTHTLTCEVVIVSADERILCGDMGIVAVHVAGDRVGAITKADDGVRATAGALALAPAASVIELESIEIDPAWLFGGEEGVRVQATFSPRNSSKQLADIAAGRVGELFSPYRVEVSIEREDGHLLLQAFSDSLGMSFKPVTRGVCVEGHSGFAEHSIVTNFKREELLGWYFGSEAQRANSKVRLFARVRALSLNGDVFISETKEFFVRPLTVGGKHVVEVGTSGPQIIDIAANTYVQTTRLSCRALINIPHGRHLEEGITVVASLIKNDGPSERIFKHRLVSHHSAAWVRQQMGLSQVPVDFEHTLADTDAAGLRIECSLISAYNEVLHTVQQEVKAVGILADAEEASRNTQVDSVASVLASSELLLVNDDDVEEKVTSKGIFSWFRRST